MAKPKTIKVGLSISVGPRKAAFNNPVEVDEDSDGMFLDNELEQLVALFETAVLSLPGNAHTRESLKEVIANRFHLVSR